MSGRPPMSMNDVGALQVRRPVAMLCRCHLTCLPQELLVNIVNYLDSVSRSNLRCTCRTLHVITNDPVIWRRRVAQICSIRQYNKTMWKVIRERRLRHLSLPCNMSLTPDHWSAICQYCPNLICLHVSCRSLLHLSEVKARHFSKLTELELRNPDGWTDLPWTLDRFPALCYLTVSCGSVRKGWESVSVKEIAKFVMPLVKLNGFTLRLDTCGSQEGLVSLLDEWPALHYLDINGLSMYGRFLLGSAGSKRKCVLNCSHFYLT